MSHEYRNQVDIRNNKIIDNLLEELPPFCADFYIHLRALRLSTNTMKGYMLEINVFLKYVCRILKKESLISLDIKDLEKIRIVQVENYIVTSEDGKELSAASQRRKLSVLKAFYNYFNTVGEIRVNPTLLLRGARVISHEVITLSQSQVTRLLDCVKYQQGMSNYAKAYNEKIVQRDIAIIMVLLGTGMRISELVGLNVSDYDLTSDEPCFHIIRKGGDDDVVYFVDAVKTAVDDYLIETRPKLEPLDEENALFLSMQRKRMTVIAIEKMVAKYCANAGLPDNISPHKMRATFASTVYKETKDIYAIKDALHHKSIDTSKNYISDKEERKKEAAQAVSGLF